MEASLLTDISLNIDRYRLLHIEILEISACTVVCTHVIPFSVIWEGLVIMTLSNNEHT